MILHTFSEFISNNSHTFRVLVKMRKVSIHMKQTTLSSTIPELTFGGFMEKKISQASPLPKRKLDPPKTDDPQEICNFPSS